CRFLGGQTKKRGNAPMGLARLYDQSLSQFVSGEEAFREGLRRYVFRTLPGTERQRLVGLVPAGRRRKNAEAGRARPVTIGRDSLRHAENACLSKPACRG